MSDLLTVIEAAEALRVHPETVQKEIRRGKLQAVKVGRAYRIRRESIEHYLEGEKISPKKVIECLDTMRDTFPFDKMPLLTAGKGTDVDDVHRVLKYLQESGVIELIDNQAKIKSLKTFAREAVEVAKISKGSGGSPWQGWFGDDLVFVSHAHRAFKGRYPKADLISFKGSLLEAHLKGFLVLAVPDMPQTCQEKELQESLITYRNSKFAFIRV